MIGLVDDGLERKYLKDIWSIQQNILNFNFFELKNSGVKKINFEVGNLFDICNSNLEKKTTFFVLAICNTIELLVKQFDYEEGKTFNSIKEICHKLDIYDLDNDLSELICTRNYLVHLDDNIKKICFCKTKKNPTSEDLIRWINLIYKILYKVDLLFNQKREAGLLNISSRYVF